MFFVGCAAGLSNQPRSRQFARRMFPLAQHILQLFAFYARQDNPIFHHDRTPVKKLT